MARTDSMVSVATGQPERSTARRQRFFSVDNSLFWLAPAIGLLLFYSIFPLAYNVFLSFNQWDIMNKVFEPVGWANWVELLTDDPRFMNALWVTARYTLIGLVVQLALGLCIALLLDAGPFGASLMQTLMILPMVTAPAVAGMLFRLLEHSDFGAISWVLYSLNIIDPTEPLLGGTGRNALAGVLIVDVWQWTPFFVLILLAGLKGLPPEILEAAEVDGASWWDRLTRIKLPLLRGVLTVAILFRLVDLFRVFDYILIMTSGGPGGRTESLSYYGYVNFTTVQWGYAATIGFVVVIIAWVVAFAYQQIFRVKW